MEKMATDGRDVGEDPDAEHDDDPRRQLTSHAKLVTEVDDECGDQDVGDEGDDEHLVVEDAVEERSPASEDGIERRHDGDRQIGLERFGDRGFEEESSQDADEQPHDGNHRGPRGSA